MKNDNFHSHGSEFIRSVRHPVEHLVNPVRADRDTALVAKTFKLQRVVIRKPRSFVVKIRYRQTMKGSC